MKSCAFSLDITLSFACSLSVSLESDSADVSRRRRNMLKVEGAIGIIVHKKF